MFIEIEIEIEKSSNPNVSKKPVALA